MGFFYRQVETPCGRNQLLVGLGVYSLELIGVIDTRAQLIWYHHPLPIAKEMLTVLLRE